VAQDEAPANARGMNAGRMHRDIKNGVSGQIVKERRGIQKVGNNDREGSDALLNLKEFLQPHGCQAQHQEKPAHIGDGRQNRS
jgi:hypothetical protein